MSYSNAFFEIEADGPIEDFSVSLPKKQHSLLRPANKSSGGNREIQRFYRNRHRCQVNGQFFDPGLLDVVSRDLASQYQQSSPFPHVELKNLGCSDCLDHAAWAFPLNNDSRWFHYVNDANQSEKRVIWNVEMMPEPIVRLINELHSEMFIAFLERLTGNYNLTADPTLYGGGLHQTGHGGRLDLHVDHDFNPNLSLYRRVTVLLYLSNWRADYGGNLELWRGYRYAGRDFVLQREKMIVPTFNTLVVFTNSETSYHGYPEVIRCPSSTFRNTIATFYASPHPHPSYSPAEHHKSRFVASRPLACKIGKNRVSIG